nr:hypothetical protein [uncultured Campylobacter sp.]
MLVFLLCLFALFAVFFAVFFMVYVASGEEVAISRIEVEKPTVILYITFGIAFIVAIIFGVTKAKSAKIDYR